MKFNGAAAVMIIEMYEPKLPLRQRRLKERHHPLAWKPMHAAEIKDETAPALAIAVFAPHPVRVLAKNPS